MGMADSAPEIDVGLAVKRLDEASQDRFQKTRPRGQFRTEAVEFV
jgi:hypothetical protein